MPEHRTVGEEDGIEGVMAVDDDDGTLDDDVQAVEVGVGLTDDRAVRKDEGLRAQVRAED